MTRPGRPPLDRTDPSASIHLRVPSKAYDELYAAAQRARTSVPEVIRRVLDRDGRRAAHDDDDDE